MKEEMLLKVTNSHKNLIVSGDIASGKTRGVLFPIVDNLVDQNESFMFLDSKEEYIERYYKKLQDKNYNVVVLNLRDSDKSNGWNPLEYAYNLYKKGDVDASMDYLDKIAKTMFYEGGSIDPFWSQSASNFFTGVVLGLFEDGKPEEINLNSVNAIFDSVNETLGLTDYLTNYFKLKDPKSKSYISASGTVLAPKDTKGSIISVARQKLRAYVSREKLSVLLNKTTFNFDDITTKPTAIFFITKDESKSLNALAAMFIEQLFSILISTNKVKFNFVLDNFDTLEQVNELNSMLCSGISRNIKFYLATRSIDDLCTKYENYILKLSNIIYSLNGNIKTIIDGEEKTVENKLEITTDKNEVEYPKLEMSQVSIFDIKSFVNQHKIDEITSKIEKPLDFDSSSIDSLIKTIDNKLEEITEMEKLNNKEVSKPTTNASKCLLKLAHLPLQGCFGTKDELAKMKKEDVVTYYGFSLNQQTSLNQIVVKLLEINSDNVKLEITPNEIATVEKYPAVITLKLNESYKVNRDVCDAMESWTITLESIGE